MTRPTDRYGLPLSTPSSPARDAYASAVDLLLAAQAGAAAMLARRPTRRSRVPVAGLT